MNEEVDDTGFFQRDFTTASEWELFNARLEEIFHEWKLCNRAPVRCAEMERNQLSVCDWSVSTEKIKFADVELDVVHYKTNFPESEVEQPKEEVKTADRQVFVDLMSHENDFCIVDPKIEGEMHPLARWYGLREFVVIVPVKHSITNQSQIKILSSSIHIAVSESSCDVPVFVQVLDKVQNVFLGVCDVGSLRISFDIVHLNVTPATCRFLPGLLGVFKGKIGIRYKDFAIASARFSYSLTNFLNCSYVVSKNIPFSDNGNEEHSTKVGLPFGVAVDPVSELVLHCMWYRKLANNAYDKDSLSVFRPLSAPAWSLRARFDETPVCFLSECIQEFLQISDSRRALTEYFPELAYGNSQSIEGSKALQRLTESKIPPLSSVIPGIAVSGKGKVELKLEGPLSDITLRDMLHYMFPDAQPDSVHVYNLPQPGQSEFDPLKIKSAHPDSLVHRLAMLLGICNSYYGGKRAVAQLWAEFAQEMRYRVERCIQIPG